MIDHLPGRAPTAPGHRPLRAAVAATLALGGLGCGQALAQQTAAEPDGLTVYDRHLPTAGTASRLGLTPFETPASVTVIDGDAIRDRGDTSVVDAITRAPGISSNASPGNGGTAVTARGFSGHGAVMQLYDGNRFYVGAGTLTFPFDTWMIERIEVLHGPASVLHGEGALGGVVNVIPRRPTPEQVSQARVTAGSHDSLFVGAGTGGPLGQAVAFRGDLSYGRSDGWMDRGRSENLSVSGVLQWDLTEDLQLTLAHDRGDQQPSRYFGVPLVDGELNRDWRRHNYNVGDARIRYRDDATRLNLSWQATPDVSVSNDAYRLASDRDWRNAETYRVQPEGDIERSVFIGINHDQTQWGNRATVAVDHELGGMANRVSVGFDLNSIDFTHTNNAPYSGSDRVPPGNPQPGLFIDEAGTFPRYNTRSRQHAVFAENRLEVSDRLALVGGLRYDGLEVDRRDLVNPDAGFEKRFSPLNWRVGSVFDVTDDFVLYAQYATHAGHLGSLITMPPGQVDFDLTTGQQWEVGLKQALPGGLGEWTLAGYHVVRRNLLSTDPEDPSVTRQIGRQSSRGVETAVALELAPQLHLHGNLALLNARYDDFVQLVGGEPVSRAGNTPTGIPERTANAQLRWGFPPDWHASVGWRYVGPRWLNADNTVRMPSYDVADATVGWRVNETVSLTLRGRNLFDTVYAVSGGLAQWRLGEDRTFELSADLRF